MASLGASSGASPEASPPFRAEIVGSLLRPRILKETAAEIALGKIDASARHRVLEQEIARVRCVPHLKQAS